MKRQTPKHKGSYCPLESWGKIISYHAYAIFIPLLFGFACVFPGFWITGQLYILIIIIIIKMIMMLSHTLTPKWSHKGCASSKAKMNKQDVWVRFVKYLIRIICFDLDLRPGPHPHTPSPTGDEDNQLILRACVTAGWARGSSCCVASDYHNQ